MKRSQCVLKQWENVMSPGAVALGFLLFTLCGAQLSAQTNVGTFVGRIVDPSGAVVPNATLSMRNQRTSFTYRAVTDQRGTYYLGLVQPGVYTLTVNANGFASYEDRDIQVTTGEQEHYDITLKVAGAGITTVVVTGGAPVIDAETPALAATQDTNMLEYKLANDFGEDDAQIQAMFTPGSDAGGYRTFFGGKFYETEMTGDGMVGVAIRMSGPPDAYSEIKTFAVLAPAEYAQPYNIDAITKGGTNNFHGAFGYVGSNPDLNARGEFSGPTPPSTTSLIRQIEVGGPVWVPHLYNGRDKTFFFFSVTSESISETLATIQSVPTDALKRGDFSSIGALTSGKVTQIIDPLTGIAFPGNVIPPTRIVGPANTIQAIFPTASNQNSLLNNVTTMGINGEPALTQSIFRVDERVTSKDNTFFIWQRWHSLYDFDASTTCGTYFGCGGALGGGFSYFIQPHDHNLWELAWTRAITPHVLNEFKYGVARFITGNGTNTSGDAITQSWGLQNIPQHPGANGNPEVDIAGFAGLNNVGTSSDTINIYQLIDNATFVKGRHSIKGGLGLVDNQDANFTGGGALFSQSFFSGEFTGYSYSDFLLGLPLTATLYSPRVEAYERSFNYGAYVEDTWRANDRLTVDLGVRWQVEAVPFEKGGLYYNFDPANGAVVVPSAAALKAVNPAFPSSIPIVTAVQAGFPSKLLEPQHNQFLPRIGLAYRPWGDKTVISMGYGIYSLSPQIYEGYQDARLQVQGPFSLSESYTNETPAQTGTGSFLWQWPDAVPAVSGAVPSQTITGVAKNFRIPYKQQWVATFERQIADWSVKASYIGEKDTQSGYQADINLPPASTAPFSLSELVYPGFRDVYLVQNGANLSYNALQIITTHQNRNGLTLSGGLTWARKVTDSGSGIFDEYADTIENPRNVRGDYGRAFDAPAVDVRFQTVYELPFGRGKKFLGAPNSLGAKIADEFAGGWVITAIPFWRTGEWVTPSFSGPDPSNTGVTSGRPQLVPGCNPANVAGGQNISHWFNVACYIIPANGTYGNAPVGSIVGPHVFEVYGGIHKDFVLAGGPGKYLRDNPVRLRIGVLAPDIFNNAMLGTPNTNISVPTTAGTITSGDIGGARAYTDPSSRNINFDVRLMF